VIPVTVELCEDCGHQLKFVRLEAPSTDRPPLCAGCASVRQARAMASQMAARNRASAATIALMCAVAWLIWLAPLGVYLIWQRLT
jgi:hypothetical protein